ncbi:MAG: hypothetical protein ACTHLK_06825 [Brucella intermedia]
MTSALRERTTLHRLNNLRITVCWPCIVLTAAGACGATTVSQAASFSASSEAELISAIDQANASGDASSTITLTGDFTVSTTLPAVTSKLTIDATAHTLTTFGSIPLDAAPGGVLSITGTTAGTGAANTYGGRLQASGGTVTLSDVTGTYAHGRIVNSGV